MQTITPCLWFDTQAEEAAKFYTSVFKNSKIGRLTLYGKEGREIHGKEEGSVMAVEFDLNGETFFALNGGPQFTFNQAVSFRVACKTQEEVDYYWRKLGDGGDERTQQCGWLKDKFGVSWQIVPDILLELLRDPNVDKAQRVMAALLKMEKIDIAGLQRAYDGG